MKGAVRGTDQPGAGKAEEKQNATQKEAFLPHHQDRNFFLPQLLNEDFPSLVARAFCSSLGRGEDQGASITKSWPLVCQGAWKNSAEDRRQNKRELKPCVENCYPHLSFTSCNTNWLEQNFSVNVWILFWLIHMHVILSQQQLSSSRPGAQAAGQGCRRFLPTPACWNWAVTRDSRKRAAPKLV